MKNEDNKDS